MKNKIDVILLIITIIMIITLICVTTVLFIGCTDKETSISGVIIDKSIRREFDFWLSELAEHDVYKNNMYLIIKNENGNITEVKVNSDTYYNYKIGDIYHG